MGEPRLAWRRDKTRKLIDARLRRAAAEGELTSIAEADCVAAFVDTVLSGMAAKARDGADRSQLLAVARHAARSW